MCLMLMEEESCPPRAHECSALKCHQAGQEPSSRNHPWKVRELLYMSLPCWTLREAGIFLRCSTLLLPNVDSGVRTGIGFVIPMRTHKTGASFLILQQQGQGVLPDQARLPCLDKASRRAAGSGGGPLAQTLLQITGGGSRQCPPSFRCQLAQLPGTQHLPEEMTGFLLPPQNVCFSGGLSRGVLRASGLGCVGSELGALVPVCGICRSSEVLFCLCIVHWARSDSEGVLL